mgnify:CR=1 FL=1
MPKKKLHLSGSVCLFLWLLKIAASIEPLTVYAPLELKQVALLVARQNGLVYTTIFSKADFYLSLTEGRTIGFEPLALCESYPDKNSFWIPYLSKKPEQKTMPVNGQYPFEEKYLNKREIKLAIRKLTWLEKLWQGWRRFRVNQASEAIRLELNPVRVALVGDIMLGRKVGEYIKLEGADYPFLPVKERLLAADLVFANLEAPTCSTGEFINLFRAHPRVVDGLKRAGIDIVSLANNHVLDYHQECLFETWELLSEAGIKQVGSGMTLKDATAGEILTVKGLKVGFLAYTETWFLYSRAGINWIAGDYPGVAPLDKALICADVKRLKSQADVVIVSLHWGIEYAKKITQEEKTLALSIIEAGGDVVFGHHPHVIKPWIFYRSKPIFYSVGNFIFDPLKPPLTEVSLLVELIYLDGLKDVIVTVTRLKECQVQLTELLPPKPDAIIN